MANSVAPPPDGHRRPAAHELETRGRARNAFESLFIIFDRTFIDSRPSSPTTPGVYERLRADDDQLGLHPPS